MAPFTVRTTCRICGSGQLQPFLDLGSTPLADAFPHKPDAPENRYPLLVKVCGECFLVQQMVDVDDAVLYGADYGFYTGASPSSIAYFASYAADLLERYPTQAKALTVEIASNDGTFLRTIQAAGAQVIGIDPAALAVKVALSNGVPTIRGSFNQDSARQIRNYGRAGLIVANNVLAHVTDLHDFLRGVEHLLAPDGIFVFEVQYFPALLDGHCFDNVYHEHRSFFSLLPLVTLLESEGFEATEVSSSDRQGGSIRVTTQRQNKQVRSPFIVAMLETEHNRGLDHLWTYLDFQREVEGIRERLLDIIHTVKGKGRTIAGYGASAKSTTMLNYCGIGGQYLDYVLDATPYKLGRFTPGTHLPIIGPSDEDGRPDYYLLLVWNYLHDVLARERGYRNRGGKFIVPIPEPRII